MANPETTNTSAKAPKTEGAFPGIPSFDPMAMWSQGQQTFTKLMTDAMGRWQTFAEQYASIEQQVTTHAQGAVTNWAQLAKDAISYGTQLSAEARKLSLETAKKMGVNVAG